MAAKAPKKASAPKKPVKPSSRSKTGNSACSQAASNWQLSIRGKEPLDPQTYATLAKCRAMNRTAKQADDRARMGYNLSDQGAAALKGRLQQRFDQGLITQKSRQERLKTLLAQRKEKQAGATAAQQKPAAPVVSATTENAGSKRLAILQGSLTKKEADLNRRFDEHFADVRSANGQPLNDKRNGPSTMARWERQSDSIRSSKTGIEKTKRAIEREKNLIDNVNSLELPPAIKTAMESGNITQWRKHPNRFFVKGVEKGRIVYFPETGTIGHHYLMDIPKEQYPLFRDTYNQLRKDLQKPAAPAPAPLSRAAALVQSVRSKPGYGVARASAAGNRELVGLRMKEKNKPATPKFSRGGQLAPGRGTEERKQDARFLLTLPKEARSAIVLAKRTFKNKGIPGSNPLGPSYAHDVYDASIKARKQFNEKDKILKSTAYKIIEAGKALKDIIKPAKTASGFTVRSAYAADLQLPSSMGGPKKGYIAKITDTDPKYKLKREFLKGSYDGAGTNYKITEKGIYETQSQSLQNRNKIDRTYELQGRNKTKELWLSNDQSGMRRGSVERAIRLLKLFSKKQP